MRNNCLLLLLSLVFLNIAIAEEPYPVKKNYDQAYVQSLAKKLGLEPDGRHIKRLLGEQEKLDWQADLEKLVVINHFKGQSGIAYPEVETINKAYKNKVVNEDKIKKILEEEIEKLQNMMMKMIEDKYPLDQCSESKTERMTIGDVNNESANQARMDILFIKHDQAPEFPEEVFGEIVSVKKYHPDKQLGIHKAAKGLKVQCLPTRFRSTSNYMFIDTGLNALKNYDEDYHGQGRLDPRYQ